MVSLRENAQTEAEDIGVSEQPFSRSNAQKRVSEMQVERDNENNEKMICSADTKRHIRINNDRGQRLVQAQEASQETDACEKQIDLPAPTFEQGQSPQAKGAQETDQRRYNPQIEFYRQLAHGTSPGSTTISTAGGLDVRHRRKNKSMNVLSSLRLSPRAKQAVTNNHAVASIVAAFEVKRLPEEYAAHPDLFSVPFITLAHVIHISRQ